MQISRSLAFYFLLKFFYGIVVIVYYLWKKEFPKKYFFFARYMHLKFEFCLINQELVVNLTLTARKTSKNILETRGFDLNRVYFVHKDFLM